jgi:hypothetical protein
MMSLELPNSTLSKPTTHFQFRIPSFKKANIENKNKVDHSNNHDSHIDNKWSPTLLSQWTGSKEVSTKLQNWIRHRMYQPFQKKFIAILSGPMGVGKSKLIQLISQELNYQLVSLDGMFDERYGFKSKESSFGTFLSYTKALIVLEFSECVPDAMIKDLCSWGKLYQKRTSYTRMFPPVIVITSQLSSPRLKSLKEVSETFTLPTRTEFDIENILFDIMTSEKLLLDSASIPHLVKSVNGNIHQLISQIQYCCASRPTIVPSSSSLNALPQATQASPDFGSLVSDRNNNLYSACSYIMNVCINPRDSSINSDSNQCVRLSTIHSPIMSDMVFHNLYGCIPLSTLPNNGQLDENWVKWAKTNSIDNKKCIVQNILNPDLNQWNAFFDAIDAFSQQDLWDSHQLEEMMQGNSGGDMTGEEGDSSSMISQISGYLGIVTSMSCISKLYGRNRKSVKNVDFPSQSMSLHSKINSQKQKWSIGQPRYDETYGQRNVLDWSLLSIPKTVDRVENGGNKVGSKPKKTRKRKKTESQVTTTQPKQSKQKK